MGISLLAMFLLAIFTLMGLDSKIIVSGDNAATLNNIAANKPTFIIGIAGYFIILILDVIVSLGLYVILKPAHKTYALITAGFRLIYTAIALVSLIALAFYHPEVYVNGLLVAYIFFILHLLSLGIVTIKSTYIPNFFGILMVVAAPFYILMTYGHLFIPDDLLDVLKGIVMIPAILAELSIAAWLLVKSRKIPDLASQQQSTVQEISWQ